MLLQNKPTKPHYSQHQLHSQVFHQTRTTIPMIRHVFALRHSIRSSSASTLKTHLNPLRHRPLFPSQTQLSPLSFKTYSSASSHNHIYTVLPEPFTLSHRMSMRFLYVSKGALAKMDSIDEKARNSEVFFVPFDTMPEHYLPTAGDGLDGGGIRLFDTAWGNRALSVVNEVLSEFGDDFKLYGFVSSPDGCIHIRIESFSQKYGCPSVEMLHNFFIKYRQRLVKEIASGILPYILGVEVGCPGRQRLLKVPDDLSRFKDIPMRVQYVQSNGQEYVGILFLCSVEKEGYCVWCSSDYYLENKDRVITRKEELTLKLPFEAHKRVTCFVRRIGL